MLLVVCDGVDVDLEKLARIERHMAKLKEEAKKNNNNNNDDETEQHRALFDRAHRHALEHIQNQKKDSMMKLSEDKIRRLNHVLGKNKHNIEERRLMNEQEKEHRKDFIDKFETMKAIQKEHGHVLEEKREAVMARLREVKEKTKV